MRAIPSFIFALTSLSLVACGDDGGSPAVDAKTPHVNPASCTISTADFGAKGALTGQGTYFASMANPAIGGITLAAPLEAGSPTDALVIEMYPGFAPFGTMAAPTAVVPGTYQITGTQLQYADCGVCARILTNLNTADGMYGDDYMATGGTVTVTAADSRVGGTVTASVTNLTFEHVTIDGTSFQSTPVNDDCEGAVTSASGTATLVAPPAKPGVVGAPAMRGYLLN